MATLNYSGAIVSKNIVGPYGETLVTSGTIKPLLQVGSSVIAHNNTTKNSSYTYLGEHQKLTESSLKLTPIQMGQRVYLPTLGRFMQVDPVEGGCSNSYSYVFADPVNSKDLDGRKSTNCSKLAQEIRNFRNVLAKRFDDYKKDVLKLPLYAPKGQRSRLGERIQMIGRQNGLRDRLNDWNSGGCGGPGGKMIPEDSWKWATKPLPPLTSNQRQQSVLQNNQASSGGGINWGKIGKYALGAGIVVGAAALTYYTGGLAAPVMVPVIVH
jgi:RHS repeat-associated protein